LERAVISLDGGCDQRQFARQAGREPTINRNINYIKELIAIAS
jgi:hypothetical protein